VLVLFDGRAGPLQLLLIDLLNELECVDGKDKHDNDTGEFQDNCCHIAVSVGA
jgi:hypothetical protein